LCKLYNRLDIDMKIRIIAILGGCITLNSGCMMAARAVAQQRQPDPGRIFDSADTNGDGVITREEFHAAREHLFARLDRNGDGYIDKDDMSGRLAGRQKAWERLTELVTQLDKDGDGRVSHSEFVDGPTPLFDRADTDHNGELSKEEVAAIRAELARAGAAGGQAK
jgi:Ca2+-binding EF-hand superfamily protein